MSLFECHLLKLLARVGFVSLFLFFALLCACVLPVYFLQQFSGASNSEYISIVAIKNICTKVAFLSMLNSSLLSNIVNSHKSSSCILQCNFLPFAYQKILLNKK